MHSPHLFYSLRRPYNDAFTIVELLVVVVIIAILAAITLVTYNGITNQANIAALQANLTQVAQKVEVYKLTSASTYPTSLAQASITPPSSGAWIYNGGGDTYCLSGSLGSLNYRVTNAAGNPTIGTCSGWINGVFCPSGFITVPGNSALGTNSFCLMKYEAKNIAGTATSQPSGQPWVSISQTDAITAAAAACSGCHLMTEAEWMTVAANALGTPANWSSGVVGSGYMYQGHISNNPASTLEASSDDTNGLYGITGNIGGAGNESRRTLTLSNGEVIWDLSGNVYEWTAQTLSTYHIGATTDSAFTWRPWTDSALKVGNLPATSLPSALSSSPGLSNVTSWDTSYGVGQIYANYNDAGTRAFIRGGTWYNGTGAGLLTLVLNSAPSSTNVNIGFRVAK